MGSEHIHTLSALRLRIGIICFMLWWIPIWLLSPAISSLLGVTSENGKHQVFLILITIQTVIGIMGFIIASRQVVTLFKKLPRKKVPAAFWHVLWTGNTENLSQAEHI